MKPIKKAILTETRKCYSLPNLCSPSAVLLQVLVAELIAFTLVLSANGLIHFSWQSLALTSLFLQWNVLLSAALLCRVRSWLPEWSLWFGAASCYFVVLLVCVVSSVFAHWLLQGSYLGLNSWNVDVWWVARNTLIAAVLAGIVLRYLYLTQQVAEREQLELRARVEALQSRIRPHFLFNSMNTIASLIPTDAEAAEQAVEDLSELFRASLTEAVEVSVEAELALCRRYVAIEALRLGQRLRVSWDVDLVPQGLAIPNLSLQPLIENAIYHGIQALPEGGEVSIRGQYLDGWLTWRVVNPIGVSADNGGNGMALNNIRDRLKVLYGGSAWLSTSVDGGIYCSEFSYMPEKGV